MPTYLSKHFTLEQLSRTSQKISNAPHSPVVISNLRKVCEHILEPVWEHYGKDVVIHSGYRNPEVNAAIGGSKTSQHMFGQAVDFHVKEHTVHEVSLWIAENLEFDQLILENFVPNVATSGWVHCSYSSRHRRDERTKFKGSKTYYKGILLSPQG